MKKDVLLTIHEFAKLHNVNKRTLHYYDDVGVFSPIKTGENGYRYYSLLQSGEFEIILALREMGMSISEIREYQKHKSNENLEALFNSKSKEIDNKLKQLKEVKKLISQKQDLLKIAVSDDINKIDIVTLKAEYLLLTDISHIKSTDDIDETVFNCLTDYNIQGKTIRAFNSSYGSMLSVDAIYKSNFESYNYIFVNIPDAASTDNLFLKEAGQYIRAYCKGSWDKIPETYKRIIKFADEHNLKLKGYSYEEGINEMAIASGDDMENYVTRITVPCCFKDNSKL